MGYHGANLPEDNEVIVSKLPRAILYRLGARVKLKAKELQALSDSSEVYEMRRVDEPPT